MHSTSSGGFPGPHVSPTSVTYSIDHKQRFNNKNAHHISRFSSGSSFVRINILLTPFLLAGILMDLDIVRIEGSGKGHGQGFSDFRTTYELQSSLFWGRCTQHML